MVELNELISDFCSVARLAGVSITDNSVTAEISPKPHIPPTELPRGKMAVYVFFWGNLCLKVGKVGPNSQARYTSQHYNPASCNSNLAKSILKKGFEHGLPSLSDKNVGSWIKSETDRVNFLLDQALGIPVLSLMESFLQCKLRPMFEGFESQK